MKKLTRIITVLLACVLATACFTASAFAAGGADTLRDPDGALVGVSNRGCAGIIPKTRWRASSPPERPGSAGC